MAAHDLFNYSRSFPDSTRFSANKQVRCEFQQSRHITIEDQSSSAIYRLLSRYGYERPHMYDRQEQIAARFNCEDHVAQELMGYIHSNYLRASPNLPAHITFHHLLLISNGLSFEVGELLGRTTRRMDRMAVGLELRDGRAADAGSATDDRVVLGHAPKVAVRRHRSNGPPLFRARKRPEANLRPDTDDLTVAYFFLSAGLAGALR